MPEDINITVAKLVEQNRTIFNAMDKIDKRVEGVEDMAMSVHDLASSIKQMTTTMEKMEKKVDSLTSEPAEKWKKATWAVLSALGGAILVIALNKMGLFI